MISTRKLLLFLFFTLSFSIYSQSFEVTFPANDINLDTIVTINCTNSNQSYNIVVHINYEDSSFLIIRNEQSIDTLNIISLSPDKQWDIPETYTLFEFKDINLDGWCDLFVLLGMDWRYWVKAYDIWLFNNENKNFTYNEVFTNNISSVYSLDDKNKTISSTFRSWNNLHEYDIETYKIDGDRLILIEKISKELLENNKYIRKYEKVINGNLELIDKVYINEDDEVIENNE
jgi:hypothetical protein